MPQIRRLNRVICFGVLTAGLLFLATCALPLVITPTAEPSATPTEGPIIMCTAPYCWEDEVYTCPSKCPGGCGTTCATRTPDPAASPTPTIPPFSSICELPVDVPTPGMALCASATEVRVGDTVQIAAVINDQGYMDFVNFIATDVNGTASFSARVRLGGHSAEIIGGGTHLAPITIQTENNRIYVLFSAESTGEIKLSFQVVPTVPDIQASITIKVLP